MQFAIRYRYQIYTRCNVRMSKLVLSKIISKFCKLIGACRALGRIVAENLNYARA